MFCYDVASLSETDCSGDDGFPEVGDVVTECIGETEFNWGDGTSTGTLFYQVTAIDPANNWLFGLALDNQSFPSIDTTLSHTYAAPGNFVAFTHSCCRISAEDGPNDHINNPDGSYRVETIINVGTANNSPASVLPPIVGCPIDGLCTFPVTGVDRDGDPLTYRLSTSAEASGISGECRGCGPTNQTAGLCTNTCTATPCNDPSRTIFAGGPDTSACMQFSNDPASCGRAWHLGGSGAATCFFVADGEDDFTQPGPPNAPNGASIDAATGLYTWNTTGATLGNDPINRNTLYSSQVTIEDGQSKVALDFLIKLGPVDADPPCLCPDPRPACACPRADDPDPPVCHTTQVVTLGERKTFRVITSDPNPSDVVTLNVVGLPVGATMTPQLPAQGNPASSTFSWIPTQSQGGALVVNFTATSSANGFATCPVTLVATPCGDGTVDGDGFDDIAGTNDDEQCDDGNTVNNDCCSSTCKFETGSCSDGDACTQSDVCDGQGNCAGSNPVVCDAAPGECRDAGSCDPQTGQCVSAARPDGTPCDSGDNCKGDTCQAGECTGLLGCPVEAVNEQGKKIAVLCRGRAGAFCEAQGSLAQLPTLAGSGTVAASVAIGAAVKCPEIVGNASVGTPVTKRVRRKIKGDGAVTLKLKLNKVGKRLLGCAARVDQGLSVNVNTAVKPSKKGPADQLVDFLVLVITK